MNNTEKFALIVAGGSGLRMQTDVPKQFLLLGGKPVLMHTIRRFAGCRIVVVLPEQHIPYWQMLCQLHDFDVPHTVVGGGTTRLESVFCGLQHVPDTALVAIHDGVRPLVSQAVIDEGFRIAEEKGNAIPVVPLTDSIRQLTDESSGSQAVDRSRFRLVQTPQIFRAGEIKAAYRNCEADNLTDDASVMEQTGAHLNLYAGDPANIKITRPADLVFAEALLSNK